MKTEKRSEQVTKYYDVFIANDGTEFACEKDCRNWEESGKAVANNSWKAIKKTQIEGATAGIEANYDDEVYIVVPQSEADVKAIVNYVRVTSCSEIELKTQDIGRAIVLNFGYDHEWCYMTYLDSIIPAIQQYHDKKLKELFPND